MILLPKCDRNEIPAITNPRIKKRAIPLHYHLHNFIMSRVPSDIYKIRNPSLHIDTDSKKSLMSVRLKRSAKLETTSDNTLSFIKQDFIAEGKPKQVQRQLVVEGQY